MNLLQTPKVKKLIKGFQSSILIARLTITPAANMGLLTTSAAGATHWRTASPMRQTV